LLVVVGVDGDDELPPVAGSGLDSGVEAEQLLVCESEGGKEFDQIFRLLRSGAEHHVI
jgi:hypothetical protein